MRGQRQAANILYDPERVSLSHRSLKAAKFDEKLNKLAASSDYRWFLEELRSGSIELEDRKEEAVTNLRLKMQICLHRGGGKKQLEDVLWLFSNFREAPLFAKEELSDDGIKLAAVTMKQFISPIGAPVSNKLAAGYLEMLKNHLPDNVGRRRVRDPEEKLLHYVLEDDPDFTLCDKDATDYSARRRKDADCTICQKCEEVYLRQPTKAYHYTERRENLDKRIYNETTPRALEWFQNAAKHNSLPEQYQDIKDKVLSLAAKSVAAKIIKRNPDIPEGELRPHLLAFLRGEATDANAKALKQIFPVPKEKIQL
jgi:hypothetical protein